MWAVDPVGEQAFGQLAEKLPGTELQSLLLEVMRRRAAARTPHEVLAQYRRDRFVRPESRRKVIFDDPARPLDARILWRPGLPPGFVVEGPAVIEEPNSTTLIHPGDRLEVSPHGHLVITVALDAAAEAAS